MYIYIYIYDFMKIFTHRVRLLFGTPSVALPFPFRFPSVMLVKWIVKTSLFEEFRNEGLLSLPFPSVPLPFSFRYAGKLQG